jgi:hypothetical protein
MEKLQYTAYTPTRKEVETSSWKPQHFSSKNGREIEGEDNPWERKRMQSGYRKRRKGILTRGSTEQSQSP